MRWYLSGIIAAVVIYTALIIVSILVFGTEQQYSLMFPTLFFSKSIRVASGFFERSEAFMVIIWIPAVFTTVTTYCFSLLRNTIVLFNIMPQHQKCAVYIQILLLFVITMVGSNELEAIKYFHSMEKPSIYQGLVFIRLMILFIWIKERRSSKNA